MKLNYPFALQKRIIILLLFRRHSKVECQRNKTECTERTGPPNLQGLNIRRENNEIVHLFYSFERSHQYDSDTLSPFDLHYHHSTQNVFSFSTEFQQCPLTIKTPKKMHF